MTPQEIEDAARRMLNATSDGLWSSQEIIENYLYFACLEMASQTYCIENRYTASSVANQQEYTKPSRAYTIKRVEYASNPVRKLKPIDFRQLDSINLNTNTTVTGTPQYYYFFDDVFGLFPIPDTSDITITIHSYDEPAKPTTTSTLQIPTRYHQRLVFGVAYMMSMKELGHPNTAMYYRMWQDALRQTIRDERARKNKDTPQRVIREEDLPSTLLGSV